MDTFLKKTHEGISGKISVQDVIILAKTIFGEARGSTHLDRVAVGFVVKNRCEKARHYKKEKKKTHPLFGDGSVSSACLAPWQFSCWNQNDPNFTLLTNLELGDGLSRSDFRKSLLAALWVIEGTSEDITKGCLHYHHHQLAWPKSWGVPKQADERIGAHLYYKNVDG